MWHHLMYTELLDGELVEQWEEFDTVLSMAYFALIYKHVNGISVVHDLHGLLELECFILLVSRG